MFFLINKNKLDYSNNRVCLKAKQKKLNLAGDNDAKVVNLAEICDILDEGDEKQ